MQRAENGVRTKQKKKNLVRGVVRCSETKGVRAAFANKIQYTTCRVRKDTQRGTRWRVATCVTAFPRVILRDSARTQHEQIDLIDRKRERERGVTH